MASSQAIDQAAIAAKKKTATTRQIHASSAHDNLHDLFAAGILSRCWCLCSRCWQRFGPELGHCICTACPCGSYRVI